MYSSGTSGKPPKAVSNSKRTWRQTNMGASFIRQRTVDDRVVVSYTPWVHGSDRGICWFASFAGAQIALVPPVTNPHTLAQNSRRAIILTDPGLAHRGPTTWTPHPTRHPNRQLPGRTLR